MMCGAKMEMVELVVCAKRRLSCVNGCFIYSRETRNKTTVYTR